MNERVKELIWKADQYSISNVERGRDSGFFHTIAMNKLAELIVLECIVQIGDAILDTNCSAADAYKTAKLAATSRVKELFGVE